MRLGRYELREELAHGGMGAVWRGWDPQAQRELAIKVLTTPDPSLSKRFLQEGRVLAQLRHPHLPTVHDLGEDGGRSFLALELIAGENLHGYVQRVGTPPLRWSLELLSTLAETVAFCHERGVVHRDIKPGNVMLERGSERVLLVDFGLVKRDAEAMPLGSLDEAQLSQTGEVLGTPQFMAPEQAQPKVFGAVGPTTDVYALGATLYFLLTREAPVAGGSWHEVMQRLVQDEPPDPRALAPGVPAEVAELCLRAMAKAPRQRPQSAAQLRAELQVLLGRLSEREGPREQRVPHAAGIAAAVVGLALVASLALVLLRRRDAERAPASPPSPASPADEAASEVERAREAFRQGRRHLQAGALEAAAEALTRALELDPTHAKTWNLRGFVWRGLGDHAASKADYERALELRPNYAAALVNRGAAWESLGDDERAMQDYTRALELRPDMAEAWHNRASLRSKRGEYEGALTDADEALRRDPRLARAWDARSTARRKLEDLAGALSDSLRASELAPDDPLVWTNLGVVRAELGQHHPAAQAFTTAIRLDPRDPFVWHERGTLLQRIGQHRSAVDDFTRAIELDPARVVSWCNRGLSQLAQRDLPAALVDFSRVLELDPERAVTWADRGTVRLRLGDYARALQDYERALQLAPAAEWRAQVEAAREECLRLLNAER